MYVVKIKNGTKEPLEIQNEHHKLLSGSVVQGINSIDSFTFSVLPNNPGFGMLYDFTTLVEVINVAKNRYEFQGRVLCTTPSMSESGLITQEATCESFFGFLCDSQQTYVEEQNWTVLGLFEHIINAHNSQVEEYKNFKIGFVNVTDPNNNLYVGIQRENTWETIKKKLIDVLGGEIRFRVESDGLYIDYLQKIGEQKTTEIALSRNMKSITKEQDPSNFITRLIPLGAKLGDNTEERVDITSVNDEKNYIDDTEAIEVYGLHIGYVEFDDVTEPLNLLSKARDWLKENNKVLIKYSVTALDLSLINLDIDDFQVHNYHPIKNRLLNIDDTARIVKKTIDVCEEVKSTFEIGESFKTLSEIQREQLLALGKLNNQVVEIIRNYATNVKLTNEINRTVSLIEQTANNITLSISQEYATKDELKNTAASLTITNDDIIAAVSGTFATKDELGKYATTQTVDNKISVAIDGIDLSVYATKEQLGDYATTETVENKISVAIDGIDLSVYATQNELLSIEGNLALEIVTADDGSKYSQLRADVDKVVFDAGQFALNSSRLTINTEGDDPYFKFAPSLSEYIKMSKDGLTTHYVQETAPDFRFTQNIGPNPYNTFDVHMLTFARTANLKIGYVAGTLLDGVSYACFGMDTTDFLYFNPNQKGFLIGTWESDAAIGTRSDRNDKHDIEELPREYESIFDSLRPVRFKYNNGTSNRYHMGFIAQEVEDAVISAGCTTEDFGAVCYDMDLGAKVNYSVRYTEIVSLNTYEIQKLKARIKELEERIAST